MAGEQALFGDMSQQTIFKITHLLDEKLCVHKRNELYPSDDRDVCINSSRFLCNPSDPEVLQRIW